MTLIKIKCPYCTGLLGVQQKNMGRRTTCPKCSELFVPSSRHVAVVDGSLPSAASEKVDDNDFKAAPLDSPANDFQPAGHKQDQWAVRRNGKLVGFFTTDQLRSMELTGELEPSDQLHRGEMRDWIPASAIVDLLVEELDEPSRRQIQSQPRSMLSDRTSDGTRAATATGLHPQRLYLLLAASGGCVSTFMPWIQIPIFGGVSGAVPLSTFGNIAPGWCTLVLFAISILVLLVGRHNRRLRLVEQSIVVTASVLSIAIGAVVISQFLYSIGSGLIVMMATSIACLVVACAFEFDRTPERSQGGLSLVAITICLTAMGVLLAYCLRYLELTSVQEVRDANNARCLFCRKEFHISEDYRDNPSAYTVDIPCPRCGTTAAPAHLYIEREGIYQFREEDNVDIRRLLIGE